MQSNMPLAGSLLVTSDSLRTAAEEVCTISHPRQSELSRVPCVAVVRTGVWDGCFLVILNDSGECVTKNYVTITNDQFVQGAWSLLGIQTARRQGFRATSMYSKGVFLNMLRWMREFM